MRILLLGGTGAMGTHLATLLANRGVDTYITSRKSRKSGDKIKFIHGNAQDNNFLDNVIKEQWDVIVDFMVYSTVQFKLKVGKLLSATDQYIFLSSARIYANSDKAITETSPRLIDVINDKEYLQSEDYAISKARQEDVLMESGKKNWVIIRPYITYGESRFQLGVLEKEDWLYRALKGKTIVISEAINKKLTTMTYGLNVAEAIFSLIGKQNALGEVFQITHEQAYSWNCILNIYLNVLENHLGYKPMVIEQPTDKFIEWKSASFQIYYDRLYNRKFDNQKIARIFDVNHFKALDEGLADCLKTFLKNPIFDTINWRAEALKDKYANEHTRINEIKGYKQKFVYIAYRYFGDLIQYLKT